MECINKVILWVTNKLKHCASFKRNFQLIKVITFPSLSMLYYRLYLFILKENPLMFKISRIRIPCVTSGMAHSTFVSDQSPRTNIHKYVIKSSMLTKCWINLGCRSNLYGFTKKKQYHWPPKHAMWEIKMFNYSPRAELLRGYHFWSYKLIY